MDNQAFALVAQAIPALPGAVVVHVRGELDVRIASAFSDELSTALGGDTRYALIVLNDVSFIDSHNIGCFVGAYQRLKSKGGWIAIICTQPYVRRVFEIMNLDKLFRFFPDWDAFVAALQADELVVAGVPVPSLIEDPPYAQSTSSGTLD